MAQQTHTQPRRDEITMAKSKLDNTPNARKLLDSLRYLGYDNMNAISDIIDNAVDADAREVRVFIHKLSEDDFVVQVADNGTGMTEDGLDQASRLGSESPRNLSSDLGRFGMGLTTASLSIGRRLTIITKAKGSTLLSNVTDVDQMIARNEFRREHFGPARPEETELFADLVGKSASGTVVQIANCDGFRARYVGSFEKNLIRHIGQVYRWFIRTGRQFYVNEIPVEISDPLFLDHPATEVFSDEIHALKYAGSEHPVQVRLVILPDHGSRELNRQKGYKPERSGFYVLRNQREIGEAELLDLEIVTRHPDWIRFRGEVFIPGTLDDAFGIEFTKRDVTPTQSIRDQLANAIGGELKTIRARLRKRVTKEEAKELDLSTAERWINSKSALLIKPTPRGDEPEPSGDDTDHAETRLGIVRFGTAHFGREGPIYAVEQQGKTITVDYNADHPFFTRFVLENREDSDALTAVNSLIFSIAVAELKTFGDNETYVSNWKAIVSSNLRTLLS